MSRPFLSQLPVDLLAGLALACQINEARQAKRSDVSNLISSTRRIFVVGAARLAIVSADIIFRLLPAVSFSIAYYLLMR